MPRHGTSGTDTTAGAGTVSKDPATPRTDTNSPESNGPSGPR
jgi:hypothetical protein